jgi:hypothetical protein
MKGFCWTILLKKKKLFNVDGTFKAFENFRKFRSFASFLSFLTFFNKYLNLKYFKELILQSNS